MAYVWLAFLVYFGIQDNFVGIAVANVVLILWYAVLRPVLAIAISFAYYAINSDVNDMVDDFLHAAVFRAVADAAWFQSSLDCSCSTCCDTECSCDWDTVLSCSPQKS